MDDELVAAGRVARLTTRGRNSGASRDVAVGFVDAPDGAVLVAAGDGTDWAENLLADPHLEVVIGERHFAALAEPLGGPDHAAAVSQLILRYGTPAEGLGRGPSFRLRPVD